MTLRLIWVKVNYQIKDMHKVFAYEDIINLVLYKINDLLDVNDLLLLNIQVFNINKI